MQRDVCSMYRNMIMCTGRAFRVPRRPPKFDEI